MFYGEDDKESKQFAKRLILIPTVCILAWNFIFQFLVTGNHQVERLKDNITLGDDWTKTVGHTESAPLVPFGNINEYEAAATIFFEPTDPKLLTCDVIEDKVYQYLKWSNVHVQADPSGLVTFDHYSPCGVANVRTFPFSPMITVHFGISQPRETAKSPSKAKILIKKQ